MTTDFVHVATLLGKLAGFRGPMTPVDEEERLHSELLSGDPVEASRALLHVLGTWAPVPGVDIADVEAVAAGLLSDLAVVPAVVGRLIDALGQHSTRAVALDALGLSGERRASGPLAEVVLSRGYRGWTEREMVKLASALGMIAGPEALSAIETLAERGPWPELIKREIQIARGGGA